MKKGNFEYADPEGFSRPIGRAKTEDDDGDNGENGRYWVESETGKLYNVFWSRLLCSVQVESPVV